MFMIYFFKITFFILLFLNTSNAEKSKVELNKASTTLKQSNPKAEVPKIKKLTNEFGFHEQYEGFYVKGGLDKKAVTRIIRANRYNFHKCYKEATSIKSKISGMVVFKWLVKGNNRNVRKVIKLESDLINSLKLETCLQDVIKNMIFPIAANGYSTTIIYPFIFTQLSGGTSSALPTLKGVGRLEIRNKKEFADFEELDSRGSSGTTALINNINYKPLKPGEPLNKEIMKKVKKIFPNYTYKTGLEVKGGLSKSMVNEYLSKQNKELRRCFLMESPKNKRKNDDLSYYIKISSTGTIESLERAESSFEGEENFLKCVEVIVNATTFPMTESLDRPTEVIYPLYLKKMK